MHEVPVCRVAAAGWMAQTQGAALEGQLPIGLHLRCCSRYYYTADTKSPILNQRAAALFLNRRGVRENIRRIKRHHIPVIGSSVAGKSTPCRAACHTTISRSGGCRASAETGRHDSAGANGDAPTGWGCTDRMGMHRRAIRRKESKRLTELRERKRLTGHWASRTSSR